MSSPFGEDILEDVPIEEFEGATLQIDPVSAQTSGNVSPNFGLPVSESNLTDAASNLNESMHSKRSHFRTAKSDPTTETFFSPSFDSCKSFYNGKGMSRSFYQQPPIGKPRRASWHNDSRLDEGIREFFSVRVGSLDQALDECRDLLDPELDGDIKSTWLLTEINHWDIEKERIVLLCEMSLLIVKYDFIAQYHIYYHRIQFSNFDKLEYGEVTYPSHSLVPHISGIAGGVATVIRGVIFNKLSTTLAKLSSWRGSAEQPGETTRQEENSGLSLSTISFEPRWRNMQGIRITWNSKYEVSFSEKWNPFCKNIPYTTFTSHPLYWYSGCEVPIYDVKSFTQELKSTLEAYESLPDCASRCSISHNEIVVENYVGIGSLLHNFGEFGFFKLRGKLSF